MRLPHLLVAGLAFTFSTAAIAQSSPNPCGPDGEAIIAHLEKEWGESVKAIALNSRGHLVRWLVNDETQTWSMVVTMPSGAGCLTADGNHFEAFFEPVGPES